MLKPYAYLSTGKSRDVQRDAPNGARVAIHYPELGRSIEIQTDAKGRYTVCEIPSPTYGGPSTEIARGTLGVSRGGA